MHTSYIICVLLYIVCVFVEDCYTFQCWNCFILQLLSILAASIDWFSYKYQHANDFRCRSGIMWLSCPGMRCGRVYLCFVTCMKGLDCLYWHVLTVSIVMVVCSCAACTCVYIWFWMSFHFLICKLYSSLNWSDIIHLFTWNSASVLYWNYIT